METNKLIAEFMQADMNDNGTFELPQYGSIRPNGAFKTEFTKDQLKYHKDWNWLMEVVEKIESMGFEVNIGGNEVQIFDQEGDLIYGAMSKTKIQSTYEAVSLFISRNVGI